MILWFYESLQRADDVLKSKVIFEATFDKKAWAIGGGNAKFGSVQNLWVDHAIWNSSL